jgi:hypothetical protein
MSQKEFEDYEVLPDVTEEGFYKVKILSGNFNGCVFNFGKVEFPNEDEPILSFEYNHLEGENGGEDSKKEYETTIGNILVELLRLALENRELIFTGGTE